MSFSWQEAGLLGCVKLADVRRHTSCLMDDGQLPKNDWYSILGADRSAHVSDLKQKYQKLILMYHPDKQSTDVPAGKVEECIQKFIKVDQAWKILGNKETKKEYDLQCRQLEVCWGPFGCGSQQLFQLYIQI
uniref:J domain-containing protein n=1 Tax=Spermophilus dauricus TaxID=99837 RepID=A0A8C9Q287_SPEDA